MSGYIIPQMDDARAKQIFIDHYSQSNSKPSEIARKQSKLDNHLQILEKEQFDAVLYSLKTFIKKIEETEIYIDLTSKLRPQMENSDCQNQIKCHQCNGKKLIDCKTCKHFYSLNCNYCKNNYLQSCNYCRNSTFTYNDKCKTCSNKRVVICDLCKGCGELMCYKGKKAVTEPIEDIFIGCKDSIPLMVLCKGKGAVLVDQTKKTLDPIDHYPDADVHAKCKELLMKHKIRLLHSPGAEVVSQNHKLVAIPIISYTAQCKNKIVKFMLIGENQDVYIPKSDKNICSVS